MDRTAENLCRLIGRALFQAEAPLSAPVDWEGIRREAAAQTVQLLVYDCLTDSERTDLLEETVRCWSREALLVAAGNERVAFEQEQALAVLKREGIPCMVIKGSSAALCYPKPELRCAGDIDLLVLSKDLERAQAALVRTGFTLSPETHKCECFLQRRNVLLELHFAVNGLPYGKIGEEMRCFFADAPMLAEERAGIPCLPTERQAIVLLLHKLSHLSSSGLGLRQLCDWAAFVHTALTPEAWGKLRPLLERFGLLRLAQTMTRICVDYLFLPAEDAAWCMEADPTLCRALMEEIMQAGNFGRKEKSHYGRHLFTDPQSEGRLSSLIHKTASAGRAHFPIFRRYPFLLPAAPAALWLRYLRQRRAGEREPFHPFAVYRDAKNRQRLYRKLRVFEVERGR